MKLKNSILIGGATVLLLAVAAVGCAPPAAVVYQGAAPVQAGASGIIVSQQSVGLWVDGLGKATSAPDIVRLSIGVESQQPTVAEAQKEAIDAMNNVVQTLKSNGIADKDIQTTQFNIQQVTKWDDKQNTYIVIGYKVSNQVTIKIRDTGKAGTIIDKSVAAGGDLIRINSISFTVDDPTPVFKVAREKAVQNAMEKAKQIAQASGVSLGNVIYISEGTVYTPVNQVNYLKSAVPMPAAAPSTSVSAGELEFQVTVSMVYEIK